MQVSRINKKKGQKKKTKIRWLRVVITTLLVILIGAGAYAYYVYHDVASAVNKMNVPLATKKPKVNFNNLDPISILMVGVDERKGDSGRTDSMIVITVNPKTQTTKLLSIPRDTRTKLINKSNPSKDRFDKINAAYAYGGIQESIDTVENFINVPIDYYIKVNMQGFQDIVDAVGGIDVDNKYAFELDGVTLQTGPQHLNGIQALEYARMRHQDPLGDFGRQERQKEVISKIVQKGKSISALTKYNSILKALENNIQTNLTLDDMIGIQSSYKAAAKNMESLQVAGNGVTIDRIWYYQVDDQERQSLSDKMRESLGLQTEAVPKIIDTKSTAQSSLASNSSNSTQSTSQKSTSTTTSTQRASSSTYTTTKPNTNTSSKSSTSGTTSSTTKPATSSNSSSSGTTTSTSGSSGTTNGSTVHSGSTSNTGTTGTSTNTGGSTSTEPAPSTTKTTESTNTSSGTSVKPSL